jgi:hypothetical protein
LKTIRWYTEEIKKLRNQKHMKAVEQKLNLCHPEVARISEQLDDIIIKYMKLIRSKHQW